jgi:hypothetical protein
MIITKDLEIMGWAAFEFIDKNRIDAFYCLYPNKQEAEETVKRKMKKGIDAFVTPIYMDVKEGYKQFNREFPK